MKYNGYILILDEQARAYGLEGRIESYQTFNEALSIPDWKPKSNELALISLDGETISYICLMKFKHKISGMDKSSYSFTDFIPIGIKFEDITKKITSRLQSYFISSTVGFGKRISPKTWECLLITIKELRPKQKKQIELLDATKEERLALSEERKGRTKADLALSIERVSEAEQNRSKAALDRAKKDGADSIELIVCSYNKTALCFYEQMGMSVKNNIMETKL